MFDVRPPKKSGGLDFEKISQVKTKIDLKEESAIPQPACGELVEPARPTLIERQVVQPLDQKTSILREFEEVFLKPVDAIAELTRVGAQIHPLIKQKPKRRIETVSLPKIAQVAPIKRVVEYKNVRMAPVFTPSNCLSDLTG